MVMIKCCYITTMLLVLATAITCIVLLVKRKNVDYHYGKYFNDLKENHATSAMVSLKL